MPLLLSVLVVRIPLRWDFEDILSQRISVIKRKIASARGVEDIKLTMGTTSRSMGKRDFQTDGRTAISL
jgi:hypothetical protein